MVVLFFFTALILLMLWFRFQHQARVANVLRPLFLLSLGGYLSMLFLADVPMDDKFLGLIKGLVVLAAAGAIIAVVQNFRGFFWLAFIAILGLCAYLFGLSPTTSKSATVDPEGELLLELKATSDIDTLKQLQQTYQLTFEPAFRATASTSPLSDWYVVDIPMANEKLLEEIKAAFAGHGAVDFVELNDAIQLEPLKAGKVSNVQKRFGLNDPGVTNLWGFEAMELQQWKKYLERNKLVPQKKARIAILDTGIDAQHEDLAANYYSTKKAYDDDRQGHGTHVAGIAAAVANNGVGVASIGLNNDFVEVTSIKVLNAFGGGTQRTIINGMIEAVDSGADVISMSLGGYSTEAKQKAYTQAVAYATQHNVIVVVSAGNSNIKAIDFSPVNTPGVIGVSAIDEQLNRAVFSNTVTELEMGIAAPGVNIYSSIPNNRYATYNGTSMSAPYVSGLIGIMKSLKPDLTTKQAYRILNRTGKNTQDVVATGKLIVPHQAIGALD